MRPPTVELRLWLLTYEQPVTPVVFTVQVLLFMAPFTVVLAHRYEWFNKRVSNTSYPPLIRVAKNFHICVLLIMVNRRGLMLLLLLGGDVSLNPGPLTLGVLNARSERVHSWPIWLLQLTLTFYASRKLIFVPFIQTAFHGL